jgi:hypothetical protein
LVQVRLEGCQPVEDASSMVPSMCVETATEVCEYPVP